MIFQRNFINYKGLGSFGVDLTNILSACQHNLREGTISDFLSHQRLYALTEKEGVLKPNINLKMC